MKNLVWGVALTIGAVIALWGFSDRWAVPNADLPTTQEGHEQETEEQPGTGPSEPKRDRSSPLALYNSRQKAAQQAEEEQGARLFEDSSMDAQEGKAKPSVVEESLGAHDAPDRFSLERLHEIGFSSSEAAALRHRWESARELALAESPKEASTPHSNLSQHRLAKQEKAFEAEVRGRVREILGDADYEAGLYGLEESNLVEINRVLTQGAAFQSGVKPGDRILGVDGQEIFSVSGLISKIAHAREVGGTLNVELLREEKRFTIALPAYQPLGMSYRGISVPPR